MIFRKLNNYVNEDGSTLWNFNNMSLLNHKLVVHPKNCNNRNDAEKFRGKKIFTPSSNFATTKKGEYFIRDLITCKIYMIDGTKIGNVVSVDNFGAGDLLETKIKNKTIYIPMNKDNLVSVDLDKQKIIVNPIKGILD